MVILHTLPELIIELERMLNFCFKGFELICSITRDCCHIVIGIAVIIGVVDLNIDLLVTSYVVDRFLVITFCGGCVNLVYVRLFRWWWLSLWLLILRQFLQLLHFYAVFPQLLHFLPFCGANWTLIMTPALTTISANADVLIVLRDNCSTSKVFWLLLVVLDAIASLKIVNDIHWLTFVLRHCLIFCWFWRLPIFIWIAISRAFVCDTVCLRSSFWVS